MHEGVHSHEKMLLRPKAPKLYVILQTFRKFLLKNHVGDKVLKIFQKIFFDAKIRPISLFDTLGSTRPWESTFCSKSTEKLRTMDNFHNILPKKAMLTVKFQ